MERNSKILVTGYRGMVGAALVRRLKLDGYNEIIVAGRDEVDLTNQAATQSFMEANQPEYVYVAAARVGGIVANSSFPAEFLHDNLMIQTNLINSAHRTQVKKLLFLGSSCIYPKLAEQPLREEYLLTGLLEPTNEAYAIAKITGIKLCDAYVKQYGCPFVSAMPCNLYGFGDNFNLNGSHVIPGMIRKFHDAVRQSQSRVTCWGTGSPKREFMFAEDLADALIFLMQKFDGPGFINVGTQEEVTIKELAHLVAEVVGYSGTIEWDHSKPDGTPRKVLDVSRLRQMDWRHRTSLRDGLQKTYDWFLANQDTYRK